MKLAGRVVLVTGANRGIGAALVTALLARDVAKVYAGARDPASLAQAQRLHGERIVPVRLDVTSEEDRRAAAARCHDLDIFVSNAGYAPAGPVLGTDETVCREAFEVNVFGPFALVRELSPVLRERRGGVLFINSLTGLVVSRSSPVYGASKAAARMLALGLRQQMGADGVVVTTSHPGFVDTAMAERIPYQKATPEEVAERSLDGLEAEATVVFPDALAEMVEQALLTRAADVLHEPQQLMTVLTGRLRDRTLRRGGSSAAASGAPPGQCRRVWGRPRSSASSASTIW
jgi:NAD(P)-dependent dehydrogenase (short-subunit alcohol dehydrogenase family)